MSADNGIMLWHDGQAYVLSEYSGSRDYDSNEEMRRLGQFPSAAAAVLGAQSHLSGHVVEYGLSLEIDERLLAREAEVQALVEPEAEAAELQPPRRRGRRSDLAESSD